VIVILKIYHCRSLYISMYLLHQQSTLLQIFYFILKHIFFWCKDIQIYRYSFFTLTIGNYYRHEFSIYLSRLSYKLYRFVLYFIYYYTYFVILQIVTYFKTFQNDIFHSSTYYLYKSIYTCFQS